MKHSIRGTAVAICIVAATVALGGTAQALTLGSKAGSVGPSSIPAVGGGEFCNWMNGPLFTGCVYSPTLRSGAASADRIAGTAGAQIVTLDSQVWRHDRTSWQRTQITQRSQSTILAGQAATTLAGLSRTTGSGYFAVSAW